MPIISISINESLKKFINKLVSKNQYENKSKLIRDALLRLMATTEYADTGIDSGFEYMPIQKNIVGNMMIVAPQDAAILKKLNKIENDYKDCIVSKNQHYSTHSLSIFMVYEGSLQDFQKIVVDINGIKEIVNFRYLIVK